jgi:hypothetical protein
MPWVVNRFLRRRRGDRRAHRARRARARRAAPAQVQGDANGLHVERRHAARRLDALAVPTDVRALLRLRRRPLHRTHCSTTRVPSRQAVCAAAAEAWAAVRAAEIPMVCLQDSKPDCAAWVGRGQCTVPSMRAFMEASCALSCGCGRRLGGRTAGPPGLLVCARGLSCRCAGLRKRKRKRTTARAHVARSAPRRIRGRARKRAPRCAD